ncbi:MAG: response regulator transcription factor [Proteobacteria bacterium]|nr:response regulator transcription factor [Pseudomonadota bacterium]
MRLLLIEDNERLAEYIGTSLRRHGFAVDSVSTAADAGVALRTTAYDMLVLDLGLPDQDGTEWLQELRRGGDARPVLILTARDKTEDVVKALNLGADDYLRKPFEVDELTARIRALLRRPSASLSAVITEANLRMDTSSRQVHAGDVLIELGKRETNCLELLLRRTGRVVTKSSLEESLYDHGEEVGSNAVEVLIHRVRKRLRDAGAEVTIHTLRGVGYMLSSGRG